MMATGLFMALLKTLTSGWLKNKYGLACAGGGTPPFPGASRIANSLSLLGWAAEDEGGDHEGVEGGRVVLPLGGVEGLISDNWGPCAIK